MSKFDSPKRIVGWSIYDLEVRRVETEAKWIGEFEKQYGVSIQCLIDAYNGCLSRGRNRIHTNRTKYMSTDFQKEGISLSRPQIDEILTRIRKCHSYYRSLLNE